MARFVLSWWRCHDDDYEQQKGRKHGSYSDALETISWTEDSRGLPGWTDRRNDAIYGEEDAPSVPRMPLSLPHSDGLGYYGKEFGKPGWIILGHF
jgi:hypothetical protein